MMILLRGEFYGSTIIHTCGWDGYVCTQFRFTSIAGDIESHSPLGFISILASSRGVRPYALKGLMAGPLKAMRPFKQSTFEYCKEKQRNTCSVMHMSLDCSVINKP